MKTASFGSISGATMRIDDLINAFAGQLEALADDNEYEALIAEAADWLTQEDNGIRTDYHQDQGGYILEELFDALDEAAPPYGYFGAHPGDGADYGFWLSECFEQDFDGLKVDDTSKVPADYCGEVLHVHDHGNMTLYAKDAGAPELREIWSLV